MDIIRRQRNVIVIVIVCSVLAITTYITVKSVSGNVSARSKPEANQATTKAIGAFKTDDTLVYERVEDQCDSSGTVGLKGREVCGFKGYKFYKSNQAVERSALNTDNQLRNAGFDRRLETNGEFTQLIKTSNINSLALEYYTSDKVWKTHALLRIHGQNQNSPDIEILLNSGKFQRPGTDEHIYGIIVDANYYSQN